MDTKEVAKEKQASVETAGQESVRLNAERQSKEHDEEIERNRKRQDPDGDGYSQGFNAGAQSNTSQVIGQKDYKPDDAGLREAELAKMDRPSADKVTEDDKNRNY